MRVARLFWNVKNQFQLSTSGDTSMQILPLSRSIGSAERSMHTLLEQKLHSANFSFSSWTVLAYTNVSPVSAEQIVQHQVGGHIVSDAYEAQKSIDGLVSTGLIVANQSSMLTHTAKGKALFKPLNTEIEEIVRALRKPTNSRSRRYSSDTHGNNQKSK